MIRARVLPHDDHEIGFLEIIVGNCRLADPDGLTEGSPGGLMAHVRAVRQVVGAEGPHEELIDESCLVGSSAARIEGGFVG